MRSKNNCPVWCGPPMRRCGVVVLCMPLETKCWFKRVEFFCQVLHFFLWRPRVLGYPYSKFVDYETLHTKMFYFLVACSLTCSFIEIHGGQLTRMFNPQPYPDLDLASNCQVHTNLVSFDTLQLEKKLLSKFLGYQGIFTGDRSVVKTELIRIL